MKQLYKVIVYTYEAIVYIDESHCVHIYIYIIYMIYT